MIKNVNYNLLNKLSYNKFNLNLPSTHVVSPQKSDYEIGVITRYFVSKRNQINIIETSARDYNNIDDSFFIKGQTEWRISGKRNNVYNGKMLIEPGVEEYNRIQVSKLKKKLPGIELILSNYFQFWRGY